MKFSKSNEDEDIEKICIAFGVSKAELKFKLKQLEAYTSLRHDKNINSLWKQKKLLLREH